MEKFEKKETFDRTYTSNKYKVIARIMRALHCNKELAEELSTKVWIKVSRHFNSYNSEKSTFNTWLNLITNRIMIDYTRSKEFKINSKSKNIQDFVDSEGNEFFQIEGSTDMQTDVNIQLSELELLVQQTLNSLSEIQQKVCNLQIQGLQMAEIAQELEIPEGTVKVYVFRFRNKLKSKLEKVY